MNGLAHGGEVVVKAEISTKRTGIRGKAGLARGVVASRGEIPSF